MIITAFNPTTDQLEKTYLSNATSAGVTVLTVKNADRFIANDRIQIGETGREKTEIVTVVSVTSTTITIGATTFSHDATDPIYRLRYDQVKFYRSTSGSNGTYSLLSTVALDVDNAELITVYDDVVGLSTYYYEISYYHSISTLESSKSDPVPGQGYARKTVGFLVDEFLREVSDTTEILTDRTEIIGWLNECSELIHANASRPYDFLHSRTTLSRTANRNYIDFPVDSNGNQIMWKFDRMDYNFTDSTVSPAVDRTYALRVIGADEFRERFQDNTISALTVSDETQLMAIDTAVDRFRFNPPFATTAGGVFYLYYWKFFTVLDSEGDVLETPTMRPYKLYLLYKFYQKRAVKDALQQSIADHWLGAYNQEINKLDKANRKDMGSPRSFKYLPQTNAGNRRF